MERFDAVIVGGGPAGSTCARSLTRAGLKVAVIDRAVFPRDKVCAGWITPAVVDLLDLDTAEYRQTRVFQPITAFRAGLMNQDSVEARYAEPVSFGIRRFEFDHFLLQRSGATLRCGEPLSSMRRSGSRWILNESVATPLVVGAGGHFCPVARVLNPGAPNRPVVAAVEIETALSDSQLGNCRVSGDAPLLEFCDDFAGYGWCFRKGRYINVGLGRVDSHELRRHAQTFLARLISDGVLPATFPTRLKGHAYLLSTGAPRVCAGDGVLLAGDAAGLADLHSGEGIRPAIESGLMAAAAVMSANGDYRDDSFADYQHQLHARFAPAPSTERLARAMPASILARLGRQLMRSPLFVQKIVLDRWFLGRDRPPLGLHLRGGLYESCRTAV